MERPKPSDVLRTFVGDPTAIRALGQRARDRRWALFTSTFPDLERMTVLDLGGAPSTWVDLAHHPAAVVLVNTDPRQHTSLPWLTTVTADACALPSAITTRPFDLVYSNSLIEHVGGHYRRCKLSEAIHKAAPRHWVQTPYRYFPLEPHWLFPLFQFLTPRARGSIARHWRLAHEYEPGRSGSENVRWVLSVELLTMYEFEYLFSNSRILFERFAGLPKSMIAVR